MTDLYGAVLGPDAVKDVEIFKKEARVFGTDTQKVHTFATHSDPTPFFLSERVVEQTFNLKVLVSASTHVVEGTPSDEARKAKLFKRKSSPDIIQDIVAP